jgi:exodeoxyribonuclease VII large subunit
VIQPGIQEPALLFADPMEVLSIAQLYARVDRALSEEFPRRQAVWVRGEVQTISDRTGHCYLDLVDPDSPGGRQVPVLRVRCWRNVWGPLRAELARSGLELTPGTVVQLSGRIDFYRARAEVTFVMTGLDVTALLGRVAAERAQLIETLKREGLFEANRSLPVPPVVLRVGLVASPGTEGCRDFLGQLTESGFGFEVLLSRAAVQGAEAPRSIARAIVDAAALVPDLVVVVRGGGSKADLVAFDSPLVARTIARCPIAVWTGIGHTGDESVADLVANRSFVTPTECGHELVLRVERFWQRDVVAPAAALGEGARRAVDSADRHLIAARGRLTGTARQQLRLHRQRLEHRAHDLCLAGPGAVDDAAEALGAVTSRMVPAVRRRLSDAEAQLAGWRRLLGAFDLERQLERGYTLTTDESGRVLRSGARLGVGDVLVTRFSDGTTRSVVTEVATGGR